MVRRLKEDIRATQGGFPERHVERVVIDGLPRDAPELELSRLFDEYRTAREERYTHTSSKAQAAAGLLVVGLQQRLLSSVEAFARSLAVHRRTVEGHWEQGQVDRTVGKEPDSSSATGQASEPESPRAVERRDTRPVPHAARCRRGAWRAGSRSDRGRGRSPDRGHHRGGGIRVDVGSRQRARGVVATGAPVARPDAGARRQGPPPARREDAAAHRLDPRADVARACRRSAVNPPARRRAGTIVASSSSRENREGTKRHLKAILRSRPSRGATAPTSASR